MHVKWRFSLKKNESTYLGRFGLSRTVYSRFYGFSSVFLDIFELKFLPREAYRLMFIHSG
jgi:hypothetical protein